MPPSPEEAAKAIEQWFAELPPQAHARSVMVWLPNGPRAPSADTLVGLSRVETEGRQLLVVLDDWMELRFDGLEHIERVSDAELALSDFDELNVSWHGPGAPPGRRYSGGTVRFVSTHQVGASDEPPEGAVWENPI